MCIEEHMLWGSVGGLAGVAKLMQQGHGKGLTFGLGSTEAGEGPTQVTAQPGTPPTSPWRLQPTHYS